MQFFKINEKGNLNEINQLDFEENRIFLVDDEKTIYIWFGNKVSKNIQDLSIKTARILNKKRSGAAKLLLMTQGREYGAFKAMMGDLKKGLKAGVDVERRPELELKPPKTLIEAEKEKEKEKEKAQEGPSNIEKWHTQLTQHRTSASVQKQPETKEEPPKIKEDLVIEQPLEEPEEEEEDTFEAAVKLKAFLISREGLNYDELCWHLAETQLSIMKGRENVIENEIKEKAEQVFNTMCTYDELCWLIGELETMVEKSYL